ncbi:MAG: DUF6713 family protein [Alphaproteobacteria bacterium]|jgi:hypothetical protein
MMAPAVFDVMLVMFFLHELDAVRCREWRYLIGLSRLPERMAASLFILLHAPLLGLIIVLSNHSVSSISEGTRLIFAALVLLHGLLHVLAPKARQAFAEPLSQLLIGLLTASGAAYLWLVLH